MSVTTRERGQVDTGMVDGEKVRTEIADKAIGIQN